MVRSMLATWRAEHPDSHPRVLVLGVTPELAKLPWPPDATVVAVDRSDPMIAALWSGAGDVASATATCGDWRALPCENGSIDLIAGDGCFSALAYPNDYRVVAAELRRVLATGGRVALRMFVPPATRDDLETIASDLPAGRIGSFHAFKWRLAMALQTTPEDGACLGAIWTAWNAMCPDPSVLSWSAETIATIDSYRDSPITYSFPTLDQIRAAFGAHLTDVSCSVPTYELGERCPTLIWRAR